MRSILLATANPAKLARLRWLVEGLPLLQCTPADLAPDCMPLVAEDGADFSANAAQKATAWSAAAGGALALASDGGLEIPALGDQWTALRTRRNAGAGADGAARIVHLLALMEGLQDEERRTFWHEAVALAEDGKTLETWAAVGDGGLIVRRHRPDDRDTELWTESIRYYPTVDKLYRDLTPAEITMLDEVWPALRAQVRDYLFRHVLGSCGRCIEEGNCNAADP